MIPQRCEDFRLALISSAFVPLGTTGSVCLKSPAKRNVTLPITSELFKVSENAINHLVSILCDIVHSSQTIKSQSCKILPSEEVFRNQTYSMTIARQI